jgi:hypothetical protein
MPTITGSWTTLSQADFEQTHPNGGFLHFRPRGVTEIDPFTTDDTNQTARELIADLAATHGWPLIGIFVSGSGESTPHLVIHRSTFPSNPPEKPERLQDDLDAAMERVYKNEQTIDDPTDPRQTRTSARRSRHVTSGLTPACSTTAAMGCMIQISQTIQSGSGMKHLWVNGGCRWIFYLDSKQVILASGPVQLRPQSKLLP